MPPNKRKALFSVKKTLAVLGDPGRLSSLFESEILHRRCLTLFDRNNGPGGDELGLIFYLPKSTILFRRKYPKIGSNNFIVKKIKSLRSLKSKAFQYLFLVGVRRFELRTS